MKRIVSLLLVLLSCVTAFAKEDPKYPVSAIPEDMKTGMYAVIREQQIRVRINSINSTSSYNKIVITILNSKASDYAEKNVGYDKLRVIKFFKGTVYDASGAVIKRLKQSDIRDQSAYDGSSLFSDNRVKSADLSQGMYPYTVEFEYEIENKFFYSLSDFQLYFDDEISIQKKEYSVTYPAALRPRYKLFKVDKPKVESIDGAETLAWRFENVKPDKFEKLGPDPYQVVPNIKISPVEFEFQGYAGKMDTWENFGKWQELLNKGRNTLPETTKQHVRELTKNAKTNEEKARILYEYLQSRTRYVSIQLGIGGLQPFEAKTVDQTGYGDCKALSNYMVSLLKEAGVTAYYSTILAGEHAVAVDPDFPSDQSDHIIVAVPNVIDTIWLECTSQTNPFGYLGNFTGDRYALMITENGGKLVKTTSYTAEQNTQSRTADVFVELTGDAKAKVKTTYRGLQYENGDLNFIVNGKYDDQKEWVQDNTEIPAFDIMSFSMTNHKDKIPAAVVNLDLTLKRFATVSGKRIFLTPNLMNRSTYIPEKLESRKTNVVLRTAYTDLDTIRYHLPEGIYPEFLPEPAKVKSRFGEYESTFTVDQGSLLYIRRVKMNKGEYPAETYKELTEFYRNISKADNTKLVFMSKT